MAHNSVVTDPLSERPPFRQWAVEAILAPRPGPYADRFVQIVSWLSLCCVALGAFIWCYADGIEINLPQTGLYLVLIIVIGAMGEVCLRGSRLAALSSPLDALAQLGLCALIFPILEFPAARLGRPLLDRKLAAADHLLGFDWSSHFLSVAAHPFLLHILQLAYLSFGLQSSVMAFSVGLVAPRRLQVCLIANFLSLSICLISFSLMPALGPMGALGVDNTGWLAQFDALRAGTLTTFVPSAVKGLVTFPSYHAAMAGLCCYGFLKLRPSFSAPFILLNIAMTISVLAVGGHYLIDLVAGIALAIAAIFAAERIGNLLSRPSLSLSNQSVNSVLF
jgi:membrane-associated phospholipid phosphatase